MKKLTEQSQLNSAAAYDEIFKHRKKLGVDKHDRKRWELLLRYYDGGDLLDAGCLDSLVPQMARKISLSATIWAIDLAEKAIAELRAKSDDEGIIYQVRDVYDTKFDDERFEYVVAGELIEHLEKPQDFIREAFRVLEPGGILAISTPLEEIREPGAKDKDRHLWSFDKNDIISMTANYGKVLKIKTMGSSLSLRPPFYHYNFPNIIAWIRKHEDRGTKEKK